MITLEIVRFCAVECELQQSGERSVSWMVDGWDYALHCDWGLTGQNVLMLGNLIEPTKNANGYRKVGVRIGWDVKPDWRLIPRQIDNLISAVDDLSPAEWFHQYEEVHPFVDGNGRTGQILFNWLNDTLDAPVWAPNYWNDDRRSQGDGAP